jgi:hypothetical protein
MKHWTLAVLFLLLSVGTAGAFETDHSAPDRSSYDPMARGSRAEQPKGIIETTLAGINQRDRNYGDVVKDWRQDVFGNTLRQVYFWGLIVLGMGLGISLAGNGWLLRERERRLTISADVVTQLFNAYIGSRAKALEVIARHNALVDRYNALDSERQRLTDQIRELSQKPVQPELDFDQAREEQISAIQPVPPPAAFAPNGLQEGETEHSEVGSLRAQLAEVETKLQRKTAQLQAKDNQITNLRERLSKAHDSLEERRKPKAQAV